ncbi:NAD(P)H-dependent oxidoreductase [Streptomyces sp. BE20]|uniref:NAD(P)H-dependent oxidoreductase n=1 Tax=Streptomycetaceae TaxID=2062 RepID=UPI002E789496|nr:MULTISPECIES: NAD(P)H-dependent oxidoreductase [unclassified Streptomyces]MED7950955.1 NAD(P)H-dependent oxidoreductase [Streptomyces sp. BE303]MEE1825197.1 NAD(P)H-dependent oxidoreductase [Streptomyces sp. BE20]
MRVLMVLDHPYTFASADNVPHQRSFTAAVAAAAVRGATAAGHDVDLIDLAADGFSPVMTRQDLVAWRQGAATDPQVRDYQDRLLAADHLVFAFPVWWEAMPAATKGFLDRVLTKGVVFAERPEAKGSPFRNLLPRLQGVTVLSVMTTPDRAYRWWYRDPLTKILFKGTFGKIGVKGLRWVNFDRVTRRTPEERRQMLLDTEKRFAALAPTRGSADPGTHGREAAPPGR